MKKKNEFTEMHDIYKMFGVTRFDWYIYINNCLIVPLIVHPVTSVQVPAASHVTVEELTVPSYPGAHDTDDASPYVVPVVLV